MEVMEAIRTRHSVRKYQKKQINREDLETIIEAGLHQMQEDGR